MRRNRRTRAPKDDGEDRVRHDYARATVVSRRIADALTAIFAGRRDFDREQLRGLHADVKYLYDIVFANTVCHLIPDTHGDHDDVDTERDRFHDTYSDGEPVSTIQPTDEVHAELIHSSFFEGDIPWFPNPTVEWPSELDRCHWGTGPTPVGWEVVVNETPMSRRRRPYAVLSREQSSQRTARWNRSGLISGPLRRREE